MTFEGVRFTKLVTLFVFVLLTGDNQFRIWILQCFIACHCTLMQHESFVAPAFTSKKCATSNRHIFQVNH